jgi:hypothetical protein
MRFVCLVCLLLSVAPLQAQLAGTAALKPRPATDRKAASATTRVAVTSATDPVGGPLIGYAARADGSGVYPLQGFPGAAFPGPRMSLLRAGGPAVISSVGGYALARGDQQGELLIYGLRPGAGSGMLAPATFRAGVKADQIVLSPLGKVALLYDRERKQVEVLAGFPGQPFSLYTSSLADLSGLLTALAVSDDGAVALAAFSSENGSGEIYALRPGSAASQAAVVSRVVHLSFIPGTRNALAADYDRSQVLMLEDGGRQGAQLLAGRGDGVQSPIAVEASSAGSVVVVNEASGTLVVVSSGQSTPLLFACGCVPTGLQRLKNPDSFRLTSGGGVQAVLQAGDAPDVFYIPAAEEPVSQPSDSQAPARTRR